MSTVFMFPGQGSQKIGMLSNAYQSFQAVKDAFQQASSALNMDLWELVSKGPESDLNKTEFTQPAILAASVGLYGAYLDEGGMVPEFFTGHSLGEYSALVVANVLGFQDAIKLVNLRGQLMQNAVPEGQGVMAAVLGLSDEEVVQSCQSVTTGVVDAVNFNSPGQVVIAGELAAVEEAGRICKEKGAKRVMPLPVSVPSHSRLMIPAAESLAEAIDQLSLQEPEVPVIQNVTGTPAENIDQLKKNLVEQLYSPVRWTQSVAWLANNGVDEFIECGPGKVLAGLVKRVDKTLSVTAIEEPEALRALLKENQF